MSLNSDRLQAKIVRFENKHENVLLMSAGDYSEELIQYITNELDDATLDTIDVHRDLERRDDLASEPITAAVLIGLSGTAIVIVGRIIERWLENRRQQQTLRIVLKAYQVSSEAGRDLASVAAKYSEIAVDRSHISPP